MVAGRNDGAMDHMTVSVLNVDVLASAIAVSQTAAQRSTLENLADISMIIIAATILALLLVLIKALSETRDGQRKVVAFIDGLRSDLAPTIKNVNELSSTLVHVSDTVSKQVSAVDDTLDIANERLRSAVDVAYRRVRHFDALLEVAQGEAESLFINAASAVRGVKRGAQAIRGRDIDRDDDDDGDRLWDDEMEQVIGADDTRDTGHTLTSSEQGPTIHRRRPRTNGPR